jgi:hypothetical protein
MLRSLETEIIQLMCAFSLIDGEFHDNELSVIHSICKEYSLDLKVLESSMETIKSENCFQLCQKLLNSFQTDELRETVLSILFEIADADNILHLDEKRFLSLISDKWGIKVTFGKGHLEWNGLQKEVIESDPEKWMFVNAGPGTGKTAVACAKVSSLIDEGISPNKIWLMSFTKTAVKEITDRISAFADSEDSVFGVKIATIDSRAWHIRYGLGQDVVKNLFGSYEAGIEEAISILDSKKDDFLEFFSGFRHIIIDEAQDIIKPRSEFILRILQLLPDDCGVTLFGDPAQAIYGFSGDRTGGKSVTILDELDIFFPKKFKEIKLSTIHRTDSPVLVKLIEDLRLDILINEKQAKNIFVETAGKIFTGSDQLAAGFDVDLFKEYQSALVLFRKRGEVLRASSMASSSGVAHRLRLGGMPQCIKPWIAQMFYDYEEQFIDKKTFVRRWDLRDYFLDTSGDTCHSAWKSLCKLVNSDNLVDIHLVRHKLSTTSPDTSMCASELGKSGPILGTIHASKGREADNVFLYIDGDTTAIDHQEECRILFVGASRAKQKLTVGKTAKTFATSIKNGRAFTRIRKKKNMNRAQVEIGRENDLDVYSTVSLNLMSEKKIFALQKNLSNFLDNGPVSVYAKRGGAPEYTYKLYADLDDENTILIGTLSKQVGYDLLEVQKKLSKGLPGTPYTLPFLNLIGLRTIVAAEGDERLNGVHPVYRKSGFWIVPVITGFPPCYFR